MKTETMMIADDLEKGQFTCEAWEEADCVIVSLEAPKTVARVVHKDFVRETLLDAGYEDGMFEIFNIDRLVCVRAITSWKEEEECSTRDSRPTEYYLKGSPVGVPD